MADYHFLTRWSIPASRERVWAILKEADRFSEWWPGFLSSISVNPEVRGVGATTQWVVRGALPYRLKYRTTTTRHDPPREVAFDADGDLQGGGRFVVDPGLAETIVTFYWDVRTTGLVMNLLAPLLRPVFAWNHNWVMSRGRSGLLSRIAMQEVE